MAESNEFLKALTSAFQGVIDPVLFTPSEVRTALEKLHNHKPRNLVMMSESTEDDLNYFYRMQSTLVRGTQKDQYRIGVLLPLLNRDETFEFYQFRAGPIPVPDRELEILIDHHPEFLLVDRSRSYHLELTPADLLSCQQVHNRYLCPQLRVLEKQDVSKCLVSGQK